MKGFSASALASQLEKEVLETGASVFTEGKKKPQTEEETANDKETVSEQTTVIEDSGDSSSTTIEQSKQEQEQEQQQQQQVEPKLEQESIVQPSNVEESSPVEEATEVLQEVQVETSPEPSEFEEAPIVSEPSLSDTTVFKRLSQTSEVDIPGGESYAELVENMVSTQCQLSGVKNLDLTTFGIRAQVLSFPNLSILTYGIHKFLGAPFTEDEENMIIHRLGLHVAQSKKEKVVVRAVQEVKDGRGMSFFSLLFTDSIAQKFANMFNYTVHANLNEADISKLVLVIQKQ